MKKGFFINSKEQKTSSSSEKENSTKEIPVVPFPTVEIGSITDFSEWNTLFNKKESQIPLIQKLKDSSALEDRKDFNDCYYVNFRQFGLSFCFKKLEKGELLDSIFFYNKDEKQGFAQFPGKLPHSLNWNMHNVQIVEKFGEPSKKAKKRTILPVFIDYEEIGLQIDFLNSSYEDLNNPMLCICIYPPKDDL